jgi:hypothetical protein
MQNAVVYGLFMRYANITMHNVADIIARWPSDAEFVRDIGAPYQTVSAWKHRGSIPSAYWRDIVLAARRRGFSEVTADLLTALHARKASEAATNGFSEESEAFRPENEAETGHFSRWKHVRRGLFASRDQIASHVAALREEWDRR